MKKFTCYIVSLRPLGRSYCPEGPGEVMGGGWGEAGKGLGLFGQQRGQGRFWEPDLGRGPWGCWKILYKIAADFSFVELGLRDKVFLRLSLRIKLA